MVRNGANRKDTFMALYVMDDGRHKYVNTLTNKRSLASWICHNNTSLDYKTVLAELKRDPNHLERYGAKCNVYLKSLCAVPSEFYSDHLRTFLFHYWYYFENDVTR